MVYVRVRKTGIIMRRGRGGEGIGEGRRESCEAPPAQGAEEGEMGLGLVHSDLCFAFSGW